MKAMLIWQYNYCLSNEYRNLFLSNSSDKNKTALHRPYIFSKYLLSVHIMRKYQLSCSI